MKLIPSAHAQYTSPYQDYYSALGLRTDLATGSIGDFISFYLPYLLTIAGLILFAILLMGGFTMLAGAANKESQEKGKKMVTSSLIGFAVIFAAYWIAQILQVIFKVGIIN